MSDSGKAIFPDFGKLVPGFDFLQNLTRQASRGASTGMPKMPNLGSWVAPTLNVEELDRRIEELKAVQFWLDQNATALKATVQALEVQKMTLAALQGMNVNVADMAKAFQMPSAAGSAPDSAPSMASGMAAATDMVNTMASNMATSLTNMANMGGMAAKPAQPATDKHAVSEKPHHHFAGLEVPETGFMRREHERENERKNQSKGAHASELEQAGSNGAAQGTAAQPDVEAQAAGTDPVAEATKAGAAMAAVVDPMQWWGALTQQFQTIANSALQEVSQRKPFEVSQGLAQDALRTANKTASDLAESTSKSMVQGAHTARDLMNSALHAGEGWPVSGAVGSAQAPARVASRSSSGLRKSAPVRAGAVASNEKPPQRRSAASGKAAKSGMGTASARSGKAEGKAEGKNSRASKTSAASGSGRSAPQARGSSTGTKSSRGSKARSTTAARKATPRAR